jgi:hypothetical protein
MLVEAARTVLIRGATNDCTLRNTFGHGRRNALQ